MNQFSTKIVGAIFLGVFAFPSFAQNWQVGGNTNPQLGGNQPVMGTIGNNPLQFITNNTQRMIIFNGGTTVTDGRIAIGNSLPANFVPNARFHMHQTGGFNNMRFTTNATGSTGTDGFELGMSDDGNVAFISNELNANFSWYNRGIGPGLLGRMRLYDGGVGMDKGRLAIGNDLPLMFTPQARLHIYQMVNDGNANGDMFRTDGLESVLNQLQMFTGGTTASLTEKFKLFIPANSSNVGLQTTQNGYLFFNTNALERVRIFNNTGSPSTPNGGGIAVNYDPSTPIQYPKSLLHIGRDDDGNSATNSGWREWMKVGTYNNFGSDMFYVGLKEENGVDRQDAVLAWGDDFNNYGGSNPYSPDFLRFIFVGENVVPGATNQQGTNGLEAARIAPNGNFGIGNFYNGVGVVHNYPARRLEVLSDKGNNTTNGNPQFRITHTQQSSINALTGKFTDMHATNLGDLAIFAKDDTQVITPGSFKNVQERFIGIHTLTPGNTLEINSQYFIPNLPNGQPQDPTIGVAPTGWAGLRFTDLNSTSVVQANPGTGVLSVDANGDVIYVLGGGLPDANNGLSTNGPTDTYVHLGQSIGAAGDPGKLLDNREIPFNGFNFLFNGNSASGTSRFCVGQNPAANLEVKNYTFNRTEANGVYSKMIYAQPLIDLELATRGWQKTANAIHGNIDNTSFLPTSGWAVGVLGESKSRYISVGVLGLSEHVGNNYEGIGVCGEFKGSAQEGYGGRFYAKGATTDYGVYGWIEPTDPGTNWAGYFAGNAMITGTPYSSVNTFALSDARIKDNIEELAKPLDIINKLKPVSFNMNNSYAPQLSFANGKQFGFIAQEVAKLLPELVNEVPVSGRLDSLGNSMDSVVILNALNYSGLIPFAIGGIQQLDLKQKVLEEKINKEGLSDVQIKTNVASFNALSKVKQLSPVSYNFTNANVPQLTFGTATDYGFVAQQLETIYPELVDTVHINENTDSLGNIINPGRTLKTINYKAMSALLTRAIQEQQFTIDSLKAINQTFESRLSNIETMLNSCCQNNVRTQALANVTQMDIELSDKDAIVLNQNVPNPFAEQTTITYNISEKAGFAQIMFIDMKGQVIKVVDIKTKGKGILNVFANDLSTGMYTYSLYVDGKLIDTKKMVKSE
ncbi:MAG TPA: tail fiber domain-containing protein [Bacteroidia bacterium]